MKSKYKYLKSKVLQKGLKCGHAAKEFMELECKMRS